MILKTLIQLGFNLTFGGGITLFNITHTNFNHIVTSAQGLIGLATGIIVFILAYWQIKKIRYDLSVKKELKRLNKKK